MAEAEPGSREATFPEQPRVDEHGPGIPWSSWCLRVGERAGLPGAGAALAEALALAAGRGAPWAPDEVRRWRRFAELLAEPVGIAEALARLWLDPDAPDLDEPARTPLLALWLGEPALAAPLTLNQFWLAVARLGGYVGQPLKHPPGWRTLWAGWHTLSTWVNGVHLFAS